MMSLKEDNRIDMKTAFAPNIPPFHYSTIPIGAKPLSSLLMEETFDLSSTLLGHLSV
jgi:hypothetical protein